MSRDSDRSGTGTAPYLYADRAYWGSWERKDPFDVVRKPSRGQLKHGGFGIVKLEKDLESVRADPTHCFYGEIERGLLDRQGFV